MLFLYALLLAFPIAMLAQRHTIESGRIRSLQVVAGDRWTDMPIIELAGNEVVNFDFDDMTHEGHRYAYKIEHCEADWTLSTELFESDFVEGFADGNLIDNFQESINTNSLYTHYHFEIPNDRCQLKMSGNYRVSVYDENNHRQTMFTAYFMVVDKRMGVTLHATSNTDIAINGKFQQISMDLNYGDLKVSDWQREIHTTVLQNHRWDNTITNPRPQYVRNDGLAWTHNRELIFNGGNEYRKFEMLDMNHTTMGLESIGWDGKNYHAFVWTDEPRPNYVYDEDANGAFFIRNSDNTEIDYTAEYATVHFRLKTPPQTGEIYLNGDWTYGMFSPQYRLEWNNAENCYEAKVNLKQGYYNYQYLLMLPNGQLTPLPSEGNFFQTGNTYSALVYYKPLGSRTDQLVAVGEIDTGAR